MKNIDFLKNHEFVEALTEDYVALFIVDLLNDSMTIPKIDESIFGKVENIGLEHDYTRFIEERVLKIINNMYLAKAIMFLDKDGIGRNINGKKEISLNVKTDGETPRFLTIKIVNIYECNRYVTIKIYDDTERINAKNRFQDKISEEYSVISSLAGNYDLIFCVSDSTNKINIYNISDEFAHLIDENSRNSDPLEKKIDALFNTIICKEYYDDFRRVTNREDIIEYLKIHKTFDFQFKANVNGLIKYYGLRIAENQYPVSKYVFGLVDETDIVETKNRTSKAIKEAETLSVISELATGYETVFIADLDRNEGKTLKITDYYSKSVDGYDYESFKNSGYRQRIEMAGQSIVHPDDRQIFFEKTQVTYLRERLTAGNSIAFDYRIVANKVVKHLRMRIAYIHGYPNKVVVGIKDVESEYQEKLLHDQLLSRALGYRNTLIETSDGYVEANISKNKIISEITNETDKTLIIKFKEAFIGEQYTYDDLLTWWADNVVIDDKKGYKNICNCEYIKAQYEAGNTILKNEYRMKLPNNDIGYFERTTYLNTDENGDIIGLTVHKNITKEYKDMGIIKALGSKYSSLYYVNLDRNEFIPYSKNKEAEEEILISNKYRESVKNYVTKKVYEADKTKVLNALDINTIKSNLKNKDLFEITYRKSNDGVLVYSEARIIKISEINGEVADVAIGLAERDKDISQRYVTNQLANEYAAIYLVDLESDMLRQVHVKQNSAFETVVEGKYSDAIRTYKSYVAPSFKDTWAMVDTPEKVREFFDEENRRENVYYVDGKNAGWRRCVAQVIERRDGVPTLIVMSFMTIDINRSEHLELNRKIAEQKVQLERQQEALKNALELAKAASYAKTSFLNNMSHDIRTPMNSIIAYAELASKHVDEPAKISDYLDKISKSSAHLLSLINDVLDMSRIEAGKVSLSESAENLSSIIHDVRNIMASNALKKKVHFYVELIEVKNENIYCDKLKLNQILLNVLSNAIKYSKDGGDVLLRIKQLPGTSNGYGTFVFNIIDHGIGMTREFVSQIFEPFARDNKVSREVSGTGLGMSITKSLVDLMGGKIDISSKENVGTEVYLEFTFKLDKEKDAINDSLIKKFKGMKALVVDDNENGRISCANVLTELGIKVDVVENGEEAIKAASKKKGKNYQLYLIDWFMPGLNGIETTKAIREIVDEDVTIILSSYETHDLQQEAIKAGVNAFISKPLFRSNLIEALSNIYGGRFDEEFTKDSKLNLNGKKVLVVEDNENNMEIARELLAQEGIVVTCVMNGKECLDYVMKAERGDIDLILMDIMMPIMDGYEATKLIRAIDDKYLSNIPIVAMTANVLPEDKEKALSLGMDDYITKPIDFDGFRLTIAKYLCK